MCPWLTVLLHVCTQLGAGSGIAAVTLALLGAPHVIATDLDPRCISLCVENAQRNGCTAKAVMAPAPPWHGFLPFLGAKQLATEQIGGAQVLAHLLAWGPEGDRDLSSILQRVGRGGFPLVVAADVLYDPDPVVHAALEHTLRGLILRGG